MTWCQSAEQALRGPCGKYYRLLLENNVPLRQQTIVHRQSPRAKYAVRFTGASGHALHADIHDVSLSDEAS